MEILTNIPGPPGGSLPRSALVLLLTLLGAGLVLSCGHRADPQWPTDNSLTVALPNAPIHLDPRLGADDASAKAAQLLYNGLVTKNPAGNLIPDLAERWEILEAGRRYRFHLRSGVTFHDGRPFTAEDVAWTFNTVLDSTVVTPKRGAFAMVERVEAVDDFTVDFHLSEPSGSLLVDLTPEQGIVPAGESAEAMDAHPIGTGPFRFAARTPETVTLTPYEAHWRGAPQLQRIVLKEVPDSTVRALELMDGAVQLVINDLTPDTIPLFRKAPQFQVIEAPSAQFAYLGFNLEDPILKDPRVRRALLLTFDRQRLVDTLWRGLGGVSDSILPPGLWAYHDDLPTTPHDPAAARRLLDEAGYPDPNPAGGGDGPGTRLTLTLKTSTSEIYLLQTQILQSMAAEAGIDLQIRSLEFATLYADVTKGSFQIFSMVRTGVVDPNIYRMILHSEALPPKGQNRGRYRNPEFDRLIEEGNQRVLPEDRRPYYLQAQEIFARDLPYIPLYTKVNYTVLAAGLEGYESYPSGELFSLRQMRWSPER